MGFYGILWDFMGFLWDFMGFYGILWVFYGILWDFMGFLWDFMGFYGILWVFYGILWDFMGFFMGFYGILWDLIGIYWTFLRIDWTFTGIARTFTGSDWIFWQWWDVDERKNRENGGLIDKNGGGTKIIDVTMGIIMGRGDMTDRTRESTKKFGDSLGQTHPKMGIKAIQMVLYYTGDGIRKVCWEVNSCSHTTQWFSKKNHGIETIESNSLCKRGGFMIHHDPPICRRGKWWSTMGWNPDSDFLSWEDL